MEPVQITPEPDEVERQAILAALADEQAERPAASEWVQSLLPERGETDAEP